MFFFTLYNKYINIGNILCRDLVASLKIQIMRNHPSFHETVMTGVVCRQETFTRPGHIVSLWNACISRVRIGNHMSLPIPFEL